MIESTPSSVSQNAIASGRFTSSSDGASAALANSVSSPPIGAGPSAAIRVIVVGLGAAPQLNGMIGTIERWNEPKKRWAVRLDGMDKLMAVREDNLQLFDTVDDLNVSDITISVPESVPRDPEVVVAPESNNAELKDDAPEDTTPAPRSRLNDLPDEIYRNILAFTFHPPNAIVRWDNATRYYTHTIGLNCYLCGKSVTQICLSHFCSLCDPTFHGLCPDVRTRVCDNRLACFPCLH